jgi:phage terminase small subunit
MPALKKIRQERFAQNLVSGLSLGKAYVSAGYKESGASANAARLLRKESVSSRLAELRAKIESAFIDLQITERNERLKAAQERWKGMREVIEARKTGDYSRALKTGLMVRKQRVIGSGKNAKFIEEYEVDTGLLDAMAALEKQAAIETGQWSETHEHDVIASSHRAMTLAEAFTIEELEGMQDRLLAVAQSCS